MLLDVFFFFFLFIRSNFYHIEIKNCVSNCGINAEKRSSSGLGGGGGQVNLGWFLFLFVFCFAFFIYFVNLLLLKNVN